VRSLVDLHWWHGRGVTSKRDVDLYRVPEGKRTGSLFGPSFSPPFPQSNVDHAPGRFGPEGKYHESN
jgi:hypothetical protein